MSSLLSVIRNHKKLFAAGFILFCGIFFVLIPLFFFQKTSPQQEDGVSETLSGQKVFQVVASEPQDGATGVYPGEQQLSFTTDQPILSEESFRLSFDPPIDGFREIESTFPTRKVLIQIYGSLKPSTVYEVSVKDRGAKQVKSWKFTTSAQQAESSSGLVKKQQEQLIEDYYPLFAEIPHTTTTYSLDYTDRLTLKVSIKARDEAAVKNEVSAWIRSQGVDPETHTINYVRS